VFTRDGGCRASTCAGGGCAAACGPRCFGGDGSDTAAAVDELELDVVGVPRSDSAPTSAGRLRESRSSDDPPTPFVPTLPLCLRLSALDRVLVSFLLIEPLPLQRWREPSDSAAGGTFCEMEVLADANLALPVPDIVDIMLLPPGDRRCASSSACPA
jgi:hypothetical protein